MRSVMEGELFGYSILLPLTISLEINLPILSSNINIFHIHSIILEADPSAVVKRVDLRNDDIPIGEQTVAQVTNTINGLFW